jgi:microcystin-dependent protein
MSLTKQELLDLVISKLAGSPNTIDASEHRELENAIVDAIFTDRSQIGDIKEISCTTQYITANFEPSSNIINEGKGKVNGERYGWAICNGKNGTVDKRGNVSIGYDPVNYQTLASTQSGGGTIPYKQGGARDVTLTEEQMPPHRHKFSDDTNGPTNTLRSNNDIIPFVTSPLNAGISANGSGTGQIYQTSRTGGSSNVTQAHNNMQPYIVTLFIQRIPTT